MSCEVSAAARLLQEASSITVMTGAGVSAESGVPTFRDAQTGLWAKYRPEDLATPQAFRRDPTTVYSWYQSRRRRVREVQPNPAHHALAELERLKSLTLVTQNVDGLHQRAGSQAPIELHGNIMRDRCADTGRALAVDDLERDSPPASPFAAQAVCRPDVVWFGEALSRDALDAAFAAASHCEVYLSVGTSSLVEPAASLASVAMEHGAAVVEINPDPTPLSPRAAVCLRYPAGEILPRLVSLIKPGV